MTKHDLIERIREACERLHAHARAHCSCGSTRSPAAGGGLIRVPPTGACRSTGKRRSRWRRPR